MKSRIFLSGIIALVMVFQMVGFASAKTAAANPLKNIAVTGTNITNGVLTITGFSVRKGKAVANGTLTGTVNGQQITQAVTLPVTTGQHTCDILSLTLGPLNLNLLGLVVDLNQVNLDITAQQGSGNLLGNLLCSVAKLLDGNGNAVGKLVGLLNDILGALG